MRNKRQLLFSCTFVPAAVNKTQTTQFAKVYADWMIMGGFVVGNISCIAASHSMRLADSMAEKWTPRIISRASLPGMAYPTSNWPDKPFTPKLFFRLKRKLITALRCKSQVSCKRQKSTWPITYEFACSALDHLLVESDHVLSVKWIAFGSRNAKTTNALSVANYVEPPPTRRLVAQILTLLTVN